MGPKILAQKRPSLRLEGAVVDRLRLLHFAVRPRADLLRRGEPDANGVELFFLGDLLEQIEQCFHSKISWYPVSRFGAQRLAINNARGRCRSRAIGSPS